MQIEELISQITELDNVARAKAQERFDNLIKPIGSLAKLEEMVSRYAGIIGKTDKNELDYPKKAVLVWSDITAAEETAKVMQGLWPINVLAAETDAAVETLMITAEDKTEAVKEGASLVKELIVKNKLQMLGYGCLSEVDNEIVLHAMAGGILQAAALKVPVMLDGLATCKSLLIAASYCDLVKQYCFAGHVSLEDGCEEALTEAQLSAPLRLEITDGCGEGAALAFTLFNAGLKAYKEMETFAEAGVHAEVKEFSHAEQIKGEQVK